MVKVVKEWRGVGGEKKESTQPRRERPRWDENAHFQMLDLLRKYRILWHILIYT